MGDIDLRAELAKAKAEFNTWPKWKQHVLRNSMKGEVSEPRQSKDSSESTEKAS